MVEKDDDPQRIKRIAAAAYDYEADSRWADYWSNILIPPHMASRSDVLDHFKRKFYRRYIVLIVAVLGMLPAVPRALSNKAYRLSLLGSACSSSLYGLPRAWNLPGIQSWFQSVISAKDFMHSLYCLTFVSSQLHLKFPLIPVLCWSLEHVAKFLRRNFARASLYRRYLEEPCFWVEANTTTLNILSSNADIALGFLLAMSLLSRQRSILQAFMYWKLLKLMYHAPVTSGYHQSAWAKIGCSVNPHIHRYAPFVITPISAIQRWWFR